ncbi:hypothetical protein sscle_01g008320 [Sclerotinia sclerotiorum 1980 UF-70]|uniref:Glycosyltransferase family 8 protein n=1 Tax=Sclerotinia sclerotiorum (strain ATCC 18683 / 1980 / Ss-1) TaxID=665079 RepID=A0A1D9PU59_SCLS1|nr:hypothetical protein sscle_01g008320 [Sclerotinia sclerotiorum 1980 UF-70]
MSHRAPLDLPDFLQNSPYLPIINFDIDEPPPSKVAKPSIAQILRSRPVRTAIPIFICGLFILFLLPRGTRKAKELNVQYKTPACLKQAPVVVEPLTGEETGIQWDKYAYITYATSKDHLCNALMLFESLQRLQSKAERVLLYPQLWKDAWVEDVHGTDMEIISKMLIQARDKYKVKLENVEILQHRHATADEWAESYTKLIAFNQTSYEKLLVLDSDSTIRHPMDELFVAPMSNSTQILAPRAYWLDAQGIPQLASHIMLIKPSTSAFERLQVEFKKAGLGTYDMDIINSAFTEQKDSCGLLDHQIYALLTGEFRRPITKHSGFWGKGHEMDIWDPESVFKKSKFVHFSDWPMRKPWKLNNLEWTVWAPKCVPVEEGDDCRARDIWDGLYKDFRERRIVSLFFLGWLAVVLLVC